MDLEALARSLGQLDPRIEAWVKTIRPHLKDTILKMVAEEPIEDYVSPQVEEILHNAWLTKQAEISATIQTKTAELEAKLNKEAEAYLTMRKQALEYDTNAKLTAFKAEFNAKAADERQ